MRKLILCSLITLCSWAVNAQTVDNAIKAIMKPQIDSVKASIAAIPTTPSNVYWDTIYVVNVTRSGNVDTLKDAGHYQISVSGALSGERIVYVAKSSTGVYSIRTANPLSWSGTGTLTTSVINNRVIVSTTASNIIYQRQKL